MLKNFRINPTPPNGKVGGAAGISVVQGLGVVAGTSVALLLWRNKKTLFKLGKRLVGALHSQINVISSHTTEHIQGKESQTTSTVTNEAPIPSDAMVLVVAQPQPNIRGKYSTSDVTNVIRLLKESVGVLSGASLQQMAALCQRLNLICYPTTPLERFLAKILRRKLYSTLTPRIVSQRCRRTPLLTAAGAEQAPTAEMADVVASLRASTAEAGIKMPHRGYEWDGVIQKLPDVVHLPYQDKDLLERTANFLMPKLIDCYERIAKAMNSIAAESGFGDNWWALDPQIIIHMCRIDSAFAVKIVALAVSTIEALELVSDMIVVLSFCENTVGLGDGYAWGQAVGNIYVLTEQNQWVFALQHDLLICEQRQRLEAAVLWKRNVQPGHFLVIPFVGIIPDASVDLSAVLQELSSDTASGKDGSAKSTLRRYCIDHIYASILKEIRARQAQAAVDAALQEGATAVGEAVLSDLFNDKALDDEAPLHPTFEDKENNDPNGDYTDLKFLDTDF